MRLAAKDNFASVTTGSLAHQRQRSHPCPGQVVNLTSPVARPGWRDGAWSASCCGTAGVAIVAIMLSYAGLRPAGAVGPGTGSGMNVVGALLLFGTLAGLASVPPPT